MARGTEFVPRGLLKTVLLIKWLPSPSLHRQIATNDLSLPGPLYLTPGALTVPEHCCSPTLSPILGTTYL